MRSFHQRIDYEDLGIALLLAVLAGVALAPTFAHLLHHVR